MAHDKQPHSLNEDQEKDDEKLRESLKVNFRLESSAFPDNKIFGIIDVEPKWAWDLIKEFTLILNGSREIKFYCQYRTISVSGFTSRGKNWSAIIKGKLVTDRWTKEVQSEPRSFYFFKHLFALSPIVNFDWARDQTKPTLVVKWRHIGDEKIHEYILYLNDKKIHHIRHQLIHNDLDVRIENLICGKTYTLQIAAKLINSKEICRSDPIEFTVPTKLDDYENEIITILNEQVTDNLRAIIEQNQEKITEKKEAEIKQENEKKTKISLQKQSDQLRLKSERLLNRLKLQIERRTDRCQTSCCYYLPHATFPGIPHYFADGVNIINKQSLSSLQRKATYSTPVLKTTSMNNNNDQNEPSAKDKRSDNSDKKK